MRQIVIAAALISALGSGQALGSSYDDLNGGIRFHNLKQWNASIMAFDKALTADDLPSGQKFIAHMDRGQAYQALGQFGLALADYSACLTLQPTSAPALLERANIYLVMNRSGDSATDLDALIELRPVLASAYNMRAVVDARLGKAKQSLADSKKVMSLLPDDYVRDLQTGIIAWQADETTAASDSFSYAAAQGAGNIYAWLWLALTKVRTGQAVPKRDLPNYDTKNWPAPIINFFTGDARQETVFATTGTGEDKITEGRVCEANFYVGEWLLQHQDKAAAQPMIQRAADNCPIYFIEWSPAQTELAKFTR